MVNIKYRHYQKGDEEQLAELFNRAFQTGGFGFLRTKKNWVWRYIQSPGFEPEMIQIAEDSDHHKIVGMICVNPIEEIYYNNNIFLNGNINDVAVHPNYTKQGIAKSLMEKSIEYMKKKQCDISLLLTDLHGFPRKKLYSKFDYKDLIHAKGYLNFPNLLQFLFDIPLGIILFPALFIFSYIPRLINRISLKVKSYSKSFNYKIIKNTDHFKYRDFALKAFKNYYTGYPSFDNEKVSWARIKVPSQRYKPTYIIVKKKDEIIGGVSLTHANIYSCKFGLKLKMGIIHELFLDPTRFKNEKELYYGFIYLIDKLLKAANKRFISILFIIVNSNNFLLKKSLKAFNFLRFQDSSIMVLNLKKEIKISKPKKYLFIPTYLSLGFP